MKKIIVLLLLLTPTTNYCNASTLIPELIQATSKKQLPKLRLLLEKEQIDPNVKSALWFDETALHQICKNPLNQNVEGALLLLEHGANPNAQTSGLKQTPLIEAVQQGSEKLVALLLDNQFCCADPSLTDALGNTALDYALRAKDGSNKEKSTIIVGLLQKALLSH